MTPEELRLECLRLALNGFSSNHVNVVERAEAFFTFLTADAPSRHEVPQRKCPECTVGQQ